MRGKPKRMNILIVLGIGIVALLAAAAAVLSQVEDWSRDFRTNFAAIEPDATDERLRPLRTSLAPAALAERVETAIKPLANWRLQSGEGAGDSIKMHFVRSTALWRFKDDIRVTITPASGSGSVLTATSQSRVGKGDLGQNPRNLRELLAAVRRTIE